MANDIQERVRALIQEQGVRRASERLGLSQNATLRLAAGSKVQRGTLALAAQNLARPTR